MLKKGTSYEVNVQGITFWRKIINEDNTEVFVKSSLNEPFMIYIDKVKGNEYLDWVTGRPFDMEDMGKDFLFGLSNIRISKNNVNLCGDVVCKAAYILDDKDKEEEYTNISEGILYTKKVFSSFYLCVKILIVQVIMMYYKISHGSVTLGNNMVLEDINFCVKDNEKIGIVGRNGSGKTTLLKAIASEYEINSGYEEVDIVSSGDFNIGYVKQNDGYSLDMKMIDYIRSSFKDILDIERKLNILEDEMSTHYDEKIVSKYNDLLSRYEYIGGYKYKKEIEVILSKFDFSDNDKDKYLNEFSGGQITKLSLIRLLLSKPDLLILDEPTNHLDIKAIEWLEDYLKGYKGSIILVSHDRMFLDNVCNVIYDIEYGSLTRYSGNYSYFVKKKEEDYIRNLKDYERQQQEIKRLQDIADRFRYKPTKAGMAMSKLKQIERMVLIDKPDKTDTKSFKINFSPEMNSYKDVLKVKNLSIGYDRELCKLSFEVERGDKLGIIGENGIGKSTFLKTIMGDVPALGGKFVFGDRVNIGYFSQALDNLNYDNSIYDEIDKEFPKLTPNEIRTLLGAFEFSGEDVFKKIKDLSGGEKVRVSLCKILNKKPNVLILDEPTNHLDIIGKDTIEKMLTSYKGTIIMVSHDRYLIKNVCNRLLVMEGGTSTLYNYGYNEYLEKTRFNNISNDNKVKIEKKKSTDKKVDSFDRNKEIKKIEKDIFELEERLSNLNNELLKEDVYMDINKANLIKLEIDIVSKDIEKKTLEWDEITKDM